MSKLTIGAVTPVTVTKVTTVVTSVTAAIRMTALMIPAAVTSILGKIPQVVTQDMVIATAAAVTPVTVIKVTVTSVTVTAIVVKKKTLRNPPYPVWNL